jgi:hypothetical protein
MKNRFNFWGTRLRFLYASSILIVVLIATFSCKKDLNPNSNSTNVVNNVMKSVPAYPLEWETADFMPTPPNMIIPVPWGGGANRGFPIEILYDYKKSDGWMLVYNVFNTSVLQPNPYFVLYNKYKGIIRVYVYINTNGYVASTYLMSGLSLAPNAKSSNMLNYIGQEIVDYNTKQTAVQQIEPFQLAYNAWYAFQYEMAYDPNIANSTYTQIGMNYTFIWQDVAKVDLGGTATGSLKGTISTPASGGFSFTNFATANATKGALSAIGYGIFNNNQGPDATKPEVNNKLNIPSILFKGVSDYFKGNLLDLPKLFFNGILGGGSSPKVENVSLTLNAAIKLQGTTTNSGAVWPAPGLGLGVPGTSNSQSAPTYIPQYNDVMGVFYVSGKPNVYATSTAFANSTLPYTIKGEIPNPQAIILTPCPPQGGNGYSGIRRHQIWITNFKIDPNFQVIINPAVLNVATVSIYKEFLFLRPNTSMQGSDYNTTQNYLSYIMAGKNTITNQYNVYSTTATQNMVYSPGCTSDLLPLPKPDFSKFNTKDNIAVRVSVTVRPIDGTPSSTIVKTFLANVIQN